MDIEPTKPEPAVTPDLIMTPSIETKILNIITRKTTQRGCVIWVVMDKHRTTTLMVPGTSKAFGSHLRKFVDNVAREVGGVVESLADAIHYVATSPCNLPKDHPKYTSDKRAGKIHLPRRKF